MSGDIQQANGAPNGALTNGGQRKGKTLKDFLSSPEVQSRLAQVANKAITAEELTRLALMAASRQPDLAKCSPNSILRSLMDASALGVKPGGTLGRGYLVPRMNKKTGELECSFDPGWRGLVDIARRSGQIISIDAKPVYQNDYFEIEFGTDAKLKHKPILEGERGKIIAAYAVAKFKDGSYQVEVLTAQDLKKIREVSRAKFGPWIDWEDEMSRKSAVRRLCKYLPFEKDLEKALELDSDEDAIGREFISMDTPSAEEKPRTKQLAEKIRAKAAATEPAPANEEAGELEMSPEDIEAAIASEQRQPGED